MNKDVIYIDVEDDITAIIGKVKDAKEKIVALVPPKNVGVLQSAVNLRLLARAATQSNKRLVLITGNAALTALAAAAQLPIARNLQSKPELAEIPALDVDDGEDIIDGAQLPVGELARTADVVSPGVAAFAEPGVDDAAMRHAAETPATARATPPAPGQQVGRGKVKNGAKVPNFNTFRKKLALIIAGAIVLIAFLVWALFFAAHATVLITARTTDQSTNTKVTLGESLATSAKAATLKASTRQLKKDVSIDFTATGTKDAGEKATGKMTVTRTSVSSNPISVPAGTSFTSGTITFVSTEGTTLAGTSIGPGGIVQDSATVAVTAAEVGDESNLSARQYQSSVSGISASGSAMSGGTHREIKIVTADDVQKATDQLNQQSNDDVKKQLAAQFDKNATIIDASFKIDQSAVKPVPAVGEEATDGKGKLTGSTMYRLAGVDKSELSSYLTDVFSKELDDKESQRIYNNGADHVTFTNVSEAQGNYSANLSATAKIGPSINDQTIKDTAKGKRYGDIQARIEAIQGVDNVDIKFWPFWVSQAPNDTSKITVEFKLNESK